MTEERTLPHALEAERSILGAILLHESVLDSLLDKLTPHEFFRAAHQKIFSTFLNLSERGVAIDLTTVVNLLASTDDLRQVGGPAYITALVDGMPRSANVEHYAAIIREKSRLRDGIAAAHRLITKAYDEHDASNLLGATAEELFALGGKAANSQPRPMSAISQSSMVAIEKAHQAGGVVTGVPTGFPELDDMLAGLQPQDLVLVAARTSIGKTAFALNVARNVAATDTVLLFSMEMSAHQIFLRMLSSEARVDSNRLRSGYLGNADWGRLSNAMCRIDETKMFIDDAPALSVLEVRAKARTVRAAHGLRLIVVDYLQLMKGHGRFDGRTQELGVISRGLKSLAKELNVPILALAQLNRAPEKRVGGRPQVSDLRESGDLENDADVVLLLHRPEGAKEQTAAEVIVGKQRNGPTGSVKLAFIREYTRFEPLDAVPA